MMIHNDEWCYMLHTMFRLSICFAGKAAGDKFEKLKVEIEKLEHEKKALLKIYQPLINITLSSQIVFFSFQERE